MRGGAGARVSANSLTHPGTFFSPSCRAVPGACPERTTCITTQVLTGCKVRPLYVVKSCTCTSLLSLAHASPTSRCAFLQHRPLHVPPLLDPLRVRRQDGRRSLCLRLLCRRHLGSVCWKVGRQIVSGTWTRSGSSVYTRTLRPDHGDPCPSELSGRKRMCLIFCATYGTSCLIVLVRSLPLLLIGRILGGVSTVSRLGSSSQHQPGWTPLTY